MNDINRIVLESLGDHFKKHWAKYALGLGSAALAGGVHSLHKSIKKHDRLLKMGLTGGGLAAGAGLSYLHYKTKPQQVINHYHQDPKSEKKETLTSTIKQAAHEAIKDKTKELINNTFDLASNYLKNKMSSNNT